MIPNEKKCKNVWVTLSKTLGLLEPKHREMASNDDGGHQDDNADTTT